MQRKVNYTFLLPAYKAAYLKEAIQSIVDQTIDGWQLIVSDDCSPEDIFSVVQQFDDERIVYRRNENNIGGGKSCCTLELVFGFMSNRVLHYGK